MSPRSYFKLPGGNSPTPPVIGRFERPTRGRHVTRKLAKTSKTTRGKNPKTTETIEKNNQVKKQQLTTRHVLSWLIATCRDLSQLIATLIALYRPPQCKHRLTTNILLSKQSNKIISHDFQFINRTKWNGDSQSDRFVCHWRFRDNVSGWHGREELPGVPEDPFGAPGRRLR